MSILENKIEIGNPEEPHCATVLLLDTSGSMSEMDKIAQLNEGLHFFKEDVSSDPLARKRVDLAVITFGSTVNVIDNRFSMIEEFNPPTLNANGQTPMGAAILKAIEMLETRKAEYRAKGTDYYRPWIFMITDGVPTDMQPGDPLWNNVVRIVRDGEENKKFLFFSVAVEPADMDLLKQIAPLNRPPIKLQQGKFKELFEWLSRSQCKVSASKVGDQTKLESPNGWSEVSTS
jgi:uncharacterized protein YegL